MKRIIILILLLSMPICLAQNVTNTPSLPGINIPFLGQITIVSVVLSVIMFVIGYFISNSIRSGLKYAAVFVAFIIVLIVLGILNKDIVSQIMDVFTVLQPIYSKFLNYQSMLGAISLPVIMFFAGFSYGLLKG